LAESKPFEATASRLERARREGDVLRSSDLSAVAALAAAFGALLLVLDPLAASARAALLAAARGRSAAGSYAEIGALAACVPAAAIAGAIFASVVPAGGLGMRFPAPKLERLDPRAGFRRMLSLDALIGAAKALLAALALGLALFPVTRQALAADGGATPARVAAQAFAAIARSIAVAVFAGSIFAWIDLLIERNKRRRRLRMNFDEVKRDQKQSEGDPSLRGRRRQAHRALAHGSIRRLPEAALVVTNPTHLAIALAYRPPQVPVPQVILRATDETARLVKRRAEQLGIPTIEDVALARSLFATTRAGDFIPRTSYAAVAAIVASLLRSGALRA
jgi:flagellar biosynthesis protein FlhB